MGEFYTRKRLRLPDYGTANTFFITVCVQNREKLLSRIIEPDNEAELPMVRLTPEGNTVCKYICTIPGVDRFVIMPNHVHMIVMNKEGESISKKMQAFKGLSSKEIGRSIWQRSFYDHAIRDEQDYLIRCKYIEENPSKWAMDEYFQK